MFNSKRNLKVKVSLVILFIILLNILGNVIIPKSKSHAEEVKINPEGTNLVDEFYPKETLKERTNWASRSWAKDLIGTKGRLGKKDGKEYWSLFTSDDVKNGGALRELEGEKGYEVKIGKKVNVENHTTDTYYAYSVNVLSEKIFKKGHIYKLDLKHILESNDYNNDNLQSLSIRIGKRTNTAGIDSDETVIENTMFPGNTWRKTSLGSYNGSIKFRGTGEKLVLGGHYSPTTFISYHKVKDLKLYDITLASELDEVSKPYTGDKIIEGTVIGSEEDERTDFQGDIVFIYKNGIKIGTTTIDENNNWSYDFEERLKADEEIKIYIVNPDSGLKSKEIIRKVDFNKEKHKPEVNELIEGDTSITGKGNSGDEIIITDEKGEILGKGEVDKDGNFEIKLDKPLDLGKITITPNIEGKEGESTKKDVIYNPELHKPEITEAKEGEKVVKGKGVSGDEIIIIDEVGKELGRGKVDEKGNFEVEIDRELVKEEEIIAVAKTGNNKSEETKVIVTYEADKHKPKLDKMKEGEKVINGKGVSGDEIVITDEAGKELGRGKVDEKGNFEVDLNRPLKRNEKIIATPITDGHKGVSDTKVVDRKPNYPPTGGGGGGSKEPEKEDKPEEKDHTIVVEDVKEGDKEITGKGNPGDEVIVIDEAGKEIGKGKVDRDGNFTIKVDTKLKEKDKLEVIPVIDGKEGKGTKVEVLESGKVTIKRRDHIAYIQGYKDGTVRPMAEISRQEVAAALYRLLPESQRDSHYTLNHNFTDIKGDQWSRKHIATLASLGIVEGNNGEFRPYDNITRAELVAMMTRFNNLGNRVDSENPVLNSSFTDVKGHWGEKDINSAAKKGWIQGYEDGTFKPNQAITRAEFVTIVNNVLNRIIKKSDIPTNIRRFTDLEEGKWYYEAMVEASNSHYYQRKVDGYEIWTQIYDGRVDW